MDRIMDEKQKKFFQFQSDWYTELEKFIKRGDKIQEKLRKEGAIAPTEVLMFLLFWETLVKKFSDEEIDFIKYMLIDILENDTRFVNEKFREFDISRLKANIKKTIH